MGSIPASFDSCPFVEERGLAIGPTAKEFLTLCGRSPT